jgi:hypothetical protein
MAKQTNRSSQPRLLGSLNLTNSLSDTAIHAITCHCQNPEVYMIGRDSHKEDKSSRIYGNRSINNGNIFRTSHDERSLGL